MVIAAGALCFCFVADESDAEAAGNTVSASADFGKVGTSITFTLNGDSAYDYKIYRMDGDSEKDKKTGTLSGESSYSATVDVTLPSKNGLYELTVYVDGTLQYGPTSVSITDGTAVMLQIPVRGKGTLPVDVYLDGAIYDSQLISFG